MFGFNQNLYRMVARAVGWGFEYQNPKFSVL